MDMANRAPSAGESDPAPAASRALGYWAGSLFVVALVAFFWALAGAAPFAVWLLVAMAAAGGAGALTGQAAAAAAGRELVAAAASRQISYPSARFGHFYTALSGTARPAAVSPALIAAALAAVVGALLRLSGHSAGLGLLALVLLAGGLGLGTFALSRAAAEHDYRQALTRESLSLYALEVAAGSHPAIPG